MGKRFGSERRRRKRGGPDCGDCGDCDCSPLLLSSWLVLVRVALGAFAASAVDPHTRPGSAGGRIVSRLIRSYQVNVSVPRARPVCNLEPSCSRYGLRAVAGHGPLRGSVLILRRLGECRRAGRAA